MRYVKTLTGGQLNRFKFWREFSLQFGSKFQGCSFVWATRWRKGQRERQSKNGRDSGRGEGQIALTSTSSSTNVLRGSPTNPCADRRNSFLHRGHSTTSPARLSTPRRSRHGKQNVCTHGSWRGLE